MASAWIKTETPEARVKIWFGFLKMAIKCDVPLKPGFYDAWGTKEELSRLSFNRWWLQRGKELFEGAVPNVTLESATDDYLIVKIPTSLKANQIRRQVSDLAFKFRGSKRLKRKPALAFTGDVNFKRLKQYERYLEIELSPALFDKSIEDKTEILRDVYRKIKDRLEKQKKTLRAAHKGQKAAKLPTARQASDFDREWVNGRLTEMKIRGITSKKVSRWRISGQHIMLNVADGQFPGTGYYGAAIGKSLATRLKAIGMDRILLVPKNKGGGGFKRKLATRRATDAEREALSLKAYGVGKAGSKPAKDSLP